MLRADLISSEARALLASVARVVLVGQRGSLADQLDRVPEPEEAVRIITKTGDGDCGASECAQRTPLEFFNGLGGFAEDGREYVTIFGPGQATPAPWINVIANPALRLPGGDRRQRLHLVGQQPREPAHAVVERSSLRSSR